MENANLMTHHFEVPDYSVSEKDRVRLALTYYMKINGLGFGGVHNEIIDLLEPELSDEIKDRSQIREFVKLRSYPSNRKIYSLFSYLSKVMPSLVAFVADDTHTLVVGQNLASFFGDTNLNASPEANLDIEGAYIAVCDTNSPNPYRIFCMQRISGAAVVIVVEIDFPTELWQKISYDLENFGAQRHPDYYKEKYRTAWRNGRSVKSALDDLLDLARDQISDVFNNEQGVESRIQVAKKGFLFIGNGKGRLFLRSILRRNIEVGSVFVFVDPRDSSRKSEFSWLCTTRIQGRGIGPIVSHSFDELSAPYEFRAQKQEVLALAKVSELSELSFISLINWRID